MGEVNYIVIPAFKVMFEIPKEYNDYDRGIIEEYDKLQELVEESDKEDRYIDDRKLKDITVHDVSSILSIFLKAGHICRLDESPHITFFLDFLQRYKIEAIIIGEYDKKEMKKYEKFKIFSRT